MSELFYEMFADHWLQATGQVKSVVWHFYLWVPITRSWRLFRPFWARSGFSSMTAVSAPFLPLPALHALGHTVPASTSLRGDRNTAELVIEISLRMTIAVSKPIPTVMPVLCGSAVGPKCCAHPGAADGILGR